MTGAIVVGTKSFRFMAWMLFAESDAGTNEYGPNPKNKSDFNEIDEIGTPTNNL